MSYIVRYSDLRKWYQGCFAILKESLVYVEDVSSDDIYDRNVKYLFNYTKLSGISEESYLSLDKIEFPHPKLGAINYKDFVIFFSRKHKIESSFRHKKGVSLNSLDIFFPNMSELYTINQNFEYSQLNLLDYRTFSIKPMLEFLTPLFIPNEYPTEKEAFKAVSSSECISKAFSRQLYYSIDNATNGIVLYRNMSVIGRFNKIKGYFIIPSTTFNEELDRFGVKYVNG